MATHEIGAKFGDLSGAATFVIASGNRYFMLMRSSASMRAMERVDHAFTGQGATVMPFSGVADSEQLNMLTALLNEHCRENGIVDEEERYEIGRVLMSFHASGITTAEALRSALASSKYRRPPWVADRG